MKAFLIFAITLLLMSCSGDPFSTESDPAESVRILATNGSTTIRHGGVLAGEAALRQLIVDLNDPTVRVISSSRGWDKEQMLEFYSQQLRLERSEASNGRSLKLSCPFLITIWNLNVWSTGGPPPNTRSLNFTATSLLPRLLA